MYENYFIFRSLTTAQKALVTLNRAGIDTKIVNAPMEHAQKGCSYAAIVSNTDADAAESVLRRENIHYNQIHKQNSQV